MRCAYWRILKKIKEPGERGGAQAANKSQNATAAEAGAGAGAEAEAGAGAEGKAESEDKAEPEGGVAEDDAAESVISEPPAEDDMVSSAGRKRQKRRAPAAPWDPPTDWDGGHAFKIWVKLGPMGAKHEDFKAPPSEIPPPETGTAGCIQHTCAQSRARAHMDTATHQPRHRAVTCAVNCIGCMQHARHANCHVHAVTAYHQTFLLCIPGVCCAVIGYMPSLRLWQKASS